MPTIKGYRSMLISVFKHTDLDLSSDPDISDLIKSFDTMKQNTQTPVSGNLDAVVHWLSGPSFEPLHTSSLRDLYRKTIFYLISQRIP